MFFKKPKLIAIFAYRYDADLIPDLLKNLEGIIDGYIAHDDRNNPNTWYNEGEIRNNLIQRARDQGADWVLCIDPDERFEKSAIKAIPKLIKKKEKIIYTFPFKELWTPTAWRSDGIWNTKKKAILFPLLDGQEFMNIPVHSQWHPLNKDYSLIHTDINLYHLKNIDPKNRTARKELYNALDPEKKIQPIGYDYLDDETGLKLTDIPEDKLFYPEFKESYNITQLGK